MAISMKEQACREEFVEEVITSVEILCRLHNVDKNLFMAAHFIPACIAVFGRHHSPQDLRAGVGLFAVNAITALVNLREAKK